MNFPAVGSLLPHDGAMVLIDRLLSADEETLCAEVRINTDTVFFDGKGVGAWVGIEYMAQAIAAHAGYLAHLRGDQVKVGFLLGSRRYECSQPLFALGSILHVHVRRTLQADNGLGAFECSIEEWQTEKNGAIIATATVTVFQPENVNDFLLRSLE